jgi:hypothetical protein
MYIGQGQAITQYTTDAAALGFCHRGPIIVLFEATGFRAERTNSSRTGWRRVAKRPSASRCFAASEAALTWPCPAHQDHRLLFTFSDTPRHWL